MNSQEFKSSAVLHQIANKKY